MAWQFKLRDLFLAITVFPLSVTLWLHPEDEEWTAGSVFVIAVTAVIFVLSSGRYRRALVLVALCMYVPYTASLWEDFPIAGHEFDETEWQRIRSWPVLPGLIIGDITFRWTRHYEFSEVAVDLATVAFTLALLVGATLIVAKNRRWAVATCIILLLLSSVNALFAWELLHAG